MFSASELYREGLKYHRVGALEWFVWEGTLKMTEFTPPATGRDPSSLLGLMTELLLRLFISLLTV